MVSDEQKENASKNVEERKIKDGEKNVHTKLNSKEMIDFVVGALEGKIESEKGGFGPKYAYNDV